jgi:hypothetical protein
MKNNLGIWIDGTKAVIVNLANDSVTEVLANIDSKTNHPSDKEVGNFLGAGHHNADEKTYEERKRNQTQAYLNNVMAKLKNADGIYVSDKKLATVLKAVDSADKMTENQIVAAVKKQFA